MVAENCSYCGHDKRAYFAQLRADGVRVVSQRCAKCNRSTLGQPFVSMLGFEWNSLPGIGEAADTQEPLLLQNPPAYKKTGRAPIGTLGYTPEE